MNFMIKSLIMYWSQVKCFILHPLSYIRQKENEVIKRFPKGFPVITHYGEKRVPKLKMKRIDDARLKDPRRESLQSSDMPGTKQKEAYKMDRKKQLPREHKEDTPLGAQQVQVSFSWKLWGFSSQTQSAL